MPIVDAYGGRKKQDVMRETWGHLAPKKNRTYRGRIVFAIGCYGNSLEPLFCEFDGLDDSPWFFEAMQDLLFDLDNVHDFDAGTIHEWVGSMRNFKFKGDVKLVLDTNTMLTKWKKVE